MSYFPYHFEAAIERRGTADSHHAVVVLPAELVAHLPAGESRPRIEADVAGFPLSAAWQPAGGVWYLLLSRRLVKEAKLEIGTVVDVYFRFVAPDTVDTPEELTAALGRNACARKTWESITPGARRTLSHRILPAKGAATRQTRVREVMHILGSLAKGATMRDATLAARAAMKGAT